MNTLIEQIYSTGHVLDADGKARNVFPSGIPLGEGKALYTMVREIGARRTLEIGFAYGLSTLFLCEALKDNGGGQHTAIDPYQMEHWSGIGLLNIQRAGLDRYLRFMDLRAHEGLPKLLSAAEKFDLVFIDGGHLFDYTLLDFFYADLLIPVGGYIFFDDLWMPSQQKLINFILRNRNYQLVPKYSPPPPSRREIFKRSVRYVAGEMKAKRLPWFGPLSLVYGPAGPVRWVVLRKCGEDTRHGEHFNYF